MQSVCAENAIKSQPINQINQEIFQFWTLKLLVLVRSECYF